MPSLKPHAILLASPGMGHLIPVVELGKRLTTYHGFDATIFVVAADPSIAKSPLFTPPPTPNALNVILLPPVDISSFIDHTTSVVTQILIMMRESVPSLRDAIAAMKAQPSALIVDIFGTEAMVLAREFNMFKYVFVTSTAWFLATTVHVPCLSERERYEHDVLKKPLQVPGCQAVHFEDTLDIFVDRTDPKLYDGFARLGIEIPTADGILLNIWQDLEPCTLNALRKYKFLEVPIYPIGPLVRPVGTGSKSGVIDWLDSQTAGSVIYVSFGSGGTLSAKQTIELAWGLELSQQRFVWVLRPPVDNDVSAAFFDVLDHKDGTPNYLPDGFLTRTRDRGLVVPMWAPQTEVLAHKSIAGFLSHCGWNSTLESIVNGVPMIAWPLYAEQKMNAAMLTDALGVAVRSKTRESGTLVRREEISDMMRDVAGAKGDGMRRRVTELKARAEEVLRKGGSSYNSLSQVAKECEVKVRGLCNRALGA